MAEWEVKVTAFHQLKAEKKDRQEVTTPDRHVEDSAPNLRRGLSPKTTGILLVPFAMVRQLAQDLDHR